MAAKTSMGVGLSITVGLLSTATLVLFILTFVFLARKQNLEQEIQKLQDEYKEVVTNSERNSDEVRKLIADAKKKNQSLAAFMVDTSRTLGEKTLGTGGVTPSALVEGIGKALEGQGAGSFAGALADRDSKLADLDKRLKDAESARQRALTDFQNAVELTSRQKADYDSGVAAMSKNINKYKDDIDESRKQLTDAMSKMTETIQKIKAQAEDQEAELNGRLTKQGDELALAQRKIADLIEKIRGKTFGPGDEAALVDGEVIGLDPVSNNVYINRGKAHKIVLGLTFEVYNNASGIRPDGASGDYPRGKATVEVVKVDESSSVARVVRNPRGNPVVKGDVIANVVYDPKKVYKFMIYGNFDTNRDGTSTPDESADIRALIQEWGGVVVDSLVGDLDFLVLGSKPVAPPAPPASAPPEVVREYLRLKRVVVEYEEIQRQAIATSTPILNQNRLFTLVGRN